MCNYFSLGVESRVGLGFEKKRTSSYLCNKCVYACEGIKKLMCCRGRARTLKVKEFLDYVTTVDEIGNDRILFASSRTQECDRYLMGNPTTLVCSNITTIMGGGVNLWEGGKER